MNNEYVEKKYVQWLLSDDTGLSSQTIWSVLSGVEFPDNTKYLPSVPYDCGDFGRCYRLLKLFPEWRSRLQEVSAKYHEWTKLVECWCELEALYEKAGTERFGPWLDKGAAKELYVKINVAIGRKP